MASPVDLVRSLVSAAQPLVGGRKDDPKGTQQAWQVEGWGFYNEAGPLRYGVTWLANLISRAVIKVGKLDDDGKVETVVEEDASPEDLIALTALDDLAGGPTGQAAMLRMFGTLILVPGQGYLVAVDTPEGRRWQVASGATISLKSAARPGKAAVYTRQIGPDASETLPADSLVVRVWQPHPNVPWEPDSATRAALQPLRELRRIAQYVDATLASRVASAGLLIFPQEASFPTATANPNEPEPQDPFITEVLNVMTTAIKNPGTASGVVPIPIKVPGQYADKVIWKDMATTLSDRVIEMRDSALRQVAIALDVPAEVLTGLGAMNHWGAWQIEEQAIKTRAEPLLDVVLGGLTDGYLLPILGAENVATPEQYVLIADTSNLVTRPDRSAAATEGYDRLELSGEAWRRETGFEEEDAPDEEELREQILKKLLSDATTALTAAELLGVDVSAATSQQPPPQSPEQGAGEPSPEDTTAPEGAPPSTPGSEPPAAGTDGQPPEEARADVIAFELVVLRALEKAGNRIRSAARGRIELGDCPPEQAHCCVGGIREPSVLLEGAWVKVPDLARSFGYEPVACERALDGYCQMILQRGYAYDRDALLAALLPVQPS